MRRRKKQYTKKEIEEMKLTKSLRFTTGSKSSFWNPDKQSGGDYVPPVADGELVRRRNKG